MSAEAYFRSTPVTARLDEMISVIQFFSSKNWIPATSSNFSFRAPEDPERIVITQSGVDKSQISRGDFMMVDLSGKTLHPKSAKPSAETLIHTEIYQNHKQVQCVLHTHSITSTALTMETQRKNSLKFEGLELIKAIRGNTTHETSLEIPLFENSQDMDAFSSMIRGSLSDKLYAFLIRGHGLYAWGESISEAKRHVEAVEFLCDVEVLRRRLRNE